MDYSGGLYTFYVIVLVDSCSKRFNVDGEKGRRECLVPLCSLKFDDVNPLIVTVALGKLYSVVIQLMGA